MKNKQIKIQFCWIRKVSKQKKSQEKSVVSQKGFTKIFITFSIFYSHFSFLLSFHSPVRFSFFEHKCSPMNLIFCWDKVKLKNLSSWSQNSNQQKRSKRRSNLLRYKENRKFRLEWNWNAFSALKPPPDFGSLFSTCAAFPQQCELCQQERFPESSASCCLRAYWARSCHRRSQCQAIGKAFSWQGLCGRILV